MQNRAMRDYAARRGWTVALQVPDVNSGVVRREARETLLEAARRREIDVVLVWRLDRWGRSVTDRWPLCKNWTTSASVSFP
jgi:putative DNA-invertase from lambdoid prophage Rac